jgi:dipeptidyl aminopeptidase/acylaminoacyl peptidase
MRTRLTTLAFVLAGCSGSSQGTGAAGPAPIATPAPDPGPAPTRPADPPAPPPAPVVDATPDTPTGAAAERDRALTQQAAGYLDAFSNVGPALTRDGKRVVFESNRDGLPQLYVAEVARPAAPPTRILTTSERMTNPLVLQGDQAILFMSDTGANERWSVFRVGLDGKGLVELTPGEPLQRDGYVVPDGVADTMYFSARKMSEPRSTVYAASTAIPGPARPIYSDDNPLFLSDVSNDGKIALATQLPSRGENYLLRIDVATGKADRLFPATGKVSIFDAELSADDKLAYVASDGGGEQSLLHALDVKTGKVVASHTIAPANAQIGGITVARRGGAIAVSLVVGNRSEIRLLDGRKLTERQTIKLPLGQGGASEFSRDGRRLVAVWSTPRTPTDLLAIEAATGKVSPLRSEDRPTLKGMPAIEASSVEIPAFDGGKIPTNVYLVAGEQAKPHPVLVIYHGGPSGVSMIRWSAATAYFASLGYAVVEPNVRGSTGFGRAYEAADDGPRRLDAFKDIETSARWVAAQPWADKTKLVVFGGSYGGYTTLIALSRWPDLWRAGVNLFGVVNLNTFMATTSGLIRKLFLVEFGDPDKDAAFLTQISPLTDVDKIVDPTFVYAGANDPRVPRTESDLIVKALRQRKVASEYMVAEDEGHSLARRANQLAFYARCARFLETHLR